ncbi:MAG: hypothetical protein MAG551_00075 [Candidatus Scalindua arabica]|uniref:Uncharacterized protein n=1 Tax=Candidatus Scalindua arabica TaxID=1127984 RepID=A0A941ZY91_9BACT|nr:hypothetical protein [Candidatus Scalindua arabica]
MSLVYSLELHLLLKFRVYITLPNPEITIQGVSSFSTYHKKLCAVL